MDKVLSKAKQALLKWREDIKDPTSDAYAKHKEYMQELADKAQRKREQEESLYEYIKTFPTFEDYVKDLQTRNRKAQQEATNKGSYLEQISEYYTIVAVAEKHGRALTEEELDRLGDEFTSSAFYYRGYIFGIAYGQGSFAWLEKWDTTKMGPEQLSLL